ncbi:hypothetical protein [Paractinoplanes durhamensis]|uniref:Uncharacterized protein n=1 Tax=Paractinoplanes durhamensis TaxID=113563 RepID=A0ABQ3YXH5_9ACTN|nr:hypothetical protein [Actinoplanes durhamensis]GIE02256.1 hypothetical protein Adu01nite_36060 [Actinoplanes durhamensis]
MNDIRLAVEMTFGSTPHGTDDQFEEFLDAVQEHLESIGREVQLSAALAERTTEFATSANGTDVNMAMAYLLMDLRTALHAAGCNTASWPTFEPTSQVVRTLQGA